jgi:hypothetical protein
MLWVGAGCWFLKFQDMGRNRGYHFGGVYLMMITILWVYIGKVYGQALFGGGMNEFRRFKSSRTVDR